MPSDQNKTADLYLQSAVHDAHISHFLQFEYPHLTAYKYQTTQAVSLNCPQIPYSPISDNLTAVPDFSVFPVPAPSSRA